MITINKMEDMQKYYDANSNTYVFDDHVTFKCNISVNARINALDINALDINAWDINAFNIDAKDIKARGDINAHAISYYAVCFAHKNIICTSIKGQKTNAKHFVLDGKIKEEKK